MQGTTTFDEVVPIKDGEFLVYGSATADARAGMSQLPEEFSHWKTVTFHEDGGESTFELKLSDHQVLSTLMSLGGTLETATIEDENYHLVVQLATAVNVGRLIEAVEESYPSLKLATRRQIPREETQVTPSVADSLDIAPPTFHHHLRKAEKKIVESVLAVE